MSNYNRNLEDLGNTIESIIDQAVSSQNFQKLNQTIRQAVNTAVDTGSEAVQRAVNEASKRTYVHQDVVDARKDPIPPRQVYAGSRMQQPHYQPNKNIYSSRLGSSRQQRARQDNLPALYKNPSGKLAGGILKTVGGGIMTLFGSGGLLASTIVALATGAGSFMLVIGGIAAAGLGGGVTLLTSGIRSIKKVNRFEQYVRALGTKTHCELQQLARIVGKSPKFVKKEIKGLIDDGMFLEGHLDEDETSLITSDETFTHYLETRRQEAIQKQEEVFEAKRKADESDAKKRDAQLQEVLDKGNAFIRQIHKCNDAIPGQEISEKISHMETLIRKIFDRAESHPEVVPELKKLMDYYLPMTVKLLNAYADMDAQPIQGENIQNSKREIEATLDTLNAAFEKLLDSIFKNVAMDVSSDISVLQTLLAQEGLTDDGFSQLKKNNL